MLFNGLTREELLDYLPQQAPFRYVDKIISVNEEEIVGQYTFKQDEYFYAGHFPDNPVTPGVILLESICQVGIVSFGIYLLSLEGGSIEIGKLLTLFTDAEVDFINPVYPRDTVVITAKKIFWRRKKLKSSVEMRNLKGRLLAHATVSGMGVVKL